MPTIQEMREERAKLVADARSIIDAAGKEKRELSKDEQVRTDKMLDDADKIKDTIAERERAEARMLRLEETERGIASEPKRNPGDGPGRGAHRREREGGADDVRELRYRVANGEERVYQFNGRLATEEYREAFNRYLRGGKAAAAGLARAEGREDRALAADSDIDGGYLLAPMQTVAGLLKAVDDAVVVRQFATVMQLTNAQSLGQPTLDTDASDAEWTSEVKTGSTDSTMKFGRRELNPSPLAKRALVSRKLLRASPMGVEALVRQRLAYKFGVTEEKAFLVGTGANQPLGLFTASANGISTNRDVSTGSTTDWTADALIDMKFTLKSQYLANARWLMHRDGMKRIRKLKDSTNQYLWQPGLSAGEPDMILNLPYTLSEFAPNTWTTGKYVAVLGDLRFYHIAEALALEIQRLDELYAESNQVGFIGRMEVDGMPALEEAFVRAKTA